MTASYDARVVECRFSRTNSVLRRNKLRMNEVVERIDLVPLLLCDELALEHGNGVHALAGNECFFGDGRRCFVADNGIQERDDANGVHHHVGRHVGIGRNSVNTFIRKHHTGFGQVVERREECKADDGFHDVELELTRFRRHGDREVCTDHIEARLIHGLRDHGIYLSRHDGGAGLHGGKIDLVEAATWT